MTAYQYAKQQFKAGKSCSMTIVAGEFGTFWLHDADWKLLDGPTYTSREAAEKARSKALDKAAKFITV